MNPRRTPGGPYGTRPDRAVIDIGSNTVRLVIFAGPPRAPETVLNEKVAARLGRDLADNRLIPDKAAEIALAALARFHALIADISGLTVDVVATAAVREARNGPDFLDRVRALGLDARVLSGEDEARASATGVIAAFPGARGTVADLGGGSLELVAIDDGNIHHGESLPLGTLRLPALRQGGPDAFARRVGGALGRADWAATHPGPLYLVGGTWRALARYAMIKNCHPLSDPHGLRLPSDEAERIARKLESADPEKLRALEGLASLRAAALPDAAALLRVLLKELAPGDLVFSSWGLREGLLHQALPDIARRQDPLLAGISHFTAARGGSISRAAMVAGWTAPVARGEGGESERLRLAATLLALAAGRVEPNLRTRHALDWALEKRWIGLDMPGRAQIAAALVGACAKPAIPNELLALCDEPLLREAIGWGLALKLCRRIGAGTRPSLDGSDLAVQGSTLVLSLDEHNAGLMGPAVRQDLETLAGWLGMTAEVRVPDAAGPPAIVTVL